MYELCRLAHFNHGDDLEMFAKERQNLGIERWLPIGFKTNSGLVTVLPGKYSIESLREYCSMFR